MADILYNLRCGDVGYLEFGYYTWRFMISTSDGFGCRYSLKGKIMNENENIVIFLDENGEKIEMEILDVINLEQGNYAFMTEMDGDNLYIFSVSDDESPVYDFVDDDTLQNKLFDMFKEKHKDEYEF